MELTRPISVDITGGKEYGFEVDGYYFGYQVRNLTHSRYGELVCELDAFEACNQGAMTPITGMRFNLGSPQARKTMVACLVGQWQRTLEYTPDYKGQLDLVCLEVIKDFRTCATPEVIYPDYEISLEVEYLIKPLLIENQPAVIFGEYMSSKSTLALLLAFMAQLPHKDNGLGLTTKEQPTNVLYLDWESDKLTFQKQESALCKGFGELAVGIHYLHFEKGETIFDVANSLIQYIKANNIGLCVIDSIGGACAGDLMDAQLALLYNKVLSQFGITTLSLTHIAKNLEGNKRSPFGSVFFLNKARTVWQLSSTKQTAVGGDIAITEQDVKLHHFKVNGAPLYPDMCYHIVHNNRVNAITIEAESIKDTIYAEEAKTPSRVLWYLQEETQASIKTMANELDIPEPSLRVEIGRMAKAKPTPLVVKSGKDGTGADLWGLPARQG